MEIRVSKSIKGFKIYMHYVAKLPNNHDIPHFVVQHTKFTTKFTTRSSFVSRWLHYVSSTVNCNT